MTTTNEVGMNAGDLMVELEKRIEKLKLDMTSASVRRLPQMRALLSAMEKRQGELKRDLR